MSEPSEWDVRDFKAWLESQELSAVVGTSDDCLDCPVANWRKSLGEGVSISADTVVFLYTIERKEAPAPDWLYWFVNDIDQMHADENEAEEEYDYRSEPIEAWECLQVVAANTQS